MDFESLHHAIRPIRSRRLDEENAEVSLEANSPKARRPEPLRKRYPNFRWRIIPAVYCAFHSALFIVELISMVFNQSFLQRGPSWLATVILIAVLLLLATVFWMKNWWNSALLAMVAVTFIQPVISML